jgi:hypothetical protein
MNTTHKSYHTKKTGGKKLISDHFLLHMSYFQPVINGGIVLCKKTLRVRKNFTGHQSFHLERQPKQQSASSLPMEDTLKLSRGEIWEDWFESSRCGRNVC